MRVTVVLLIIFLGASGLVLHRLREVAVENPAGVLPAEAAGGWEHGVYLAHVWGSLFFLVAFPLYAWDHIRKRRHWLRRLRLASISGLAQLAAALVLIFSGLLLFVFDAGSWPLLQESHHLATFVLLLGLLAHRLASKRE